MKYPPSYEHWTDDQRLAYEDRQVRRGVRRGLRRAEFLGILLGICYAVLTFAVIVLLAKLGGLVFGWTA